MNHRFRVTEATRRVVLGSLVVLTALGLTWPTPAAALPTPQSSLNKCQIAAKNEGAKFTKKVTLAIATCLKKVSTDIIKSNTVISVKTARACIAQFRKIHDTRVLGKSFEEKKVAAILKKCNPGNPMVTHTVNDVLGPGASVMQPIKATQLNAWCSRFGGDGAISNVAEWITCIDNAEICSINGAIAVQFPRALEWFDLLKPVMLSVLPPSTDLLKTSDAVAGLDAVNNAIEGSVNDDLPDIECGVAPTPTPPTCSTGCCYVEFTLGAPGTAQTSCFQYTGTASQVSAFSSNCTGKTSTPPSGWTLTATAGVCTIGPVKGTPCSAGGTPTAFVLLPTDASCP